MNRSGLRRYQKEMLASLPRQRGLRQTLLPGFQRYLALLTEEIDSPTYDDLLAAFGPPEEMASTLLQAADIPPASPSKKRRYPILACCFALLVLGIALAAFWKVPEVGVVLPGTLSTPSVINDDSYFILEDPFTYSDSQWKQPWGMDYSVEIHNTGAQPVNVTIRYAGGQPPHTFSVPSNGTETFVVKEPRSGSHRVSFITDDGTLSGTVRVLVEKTTA